MGSVRTGYILCNFATQGKSETNRVKIKLLALAGCATVLVSCDEGVQPVVEEQSQFLAVTRAWAPGERAATITEVETTGALGFFSPYASTIFAHPDSVTVIEPNPAWTPPSPAVRGARIQPHLTSSQFSQAWIMAGIRIESYNDSQVPPDTLIWTGVFFYDPNNPSNRGFVLRGGASTTFNPTNVDNDAFEASGNRSGVGGGEVAASGAVWSANGGPTVPRRNTFEVESQSFGAGSTVTTGPWLGGTQAGGRMDGRLKRVVFNRISTFGTPTTYEIDVDFRNGIQALKIVCNFPTPCTSNVLVLRDAP